MTEQQKAYRREYYKKNRSKIYENNQRWLFKNRDRWNAYVLERYHKKRRDEMKDYQGNFKEFKDKLEKAGITKDMFDIETECAGLTYSEIDGVVNVVIEHNVK